MSGRERLSTRKPDVWRNHCYLDSMLASHPPASFGVQSPPKTLLQNPKKEPELPLHPSIARATPPRPYSEALARLIASSSSAKGDSETTGPKISSSGAKPSETVSAAWSRVGGGEKERRREGEKGRRGEDGWVMGGSGDGFFAQQEGSIMFYMRILTISYGFLVSCFCNLGMGQNERPAKAPLEGECWRGLSLFPSEFWKAQLVKRNIDHLATCKDFPLLQAESTNIPSTIQTYPNPASTKAGLSTVTLLSTWDVDGEHPNAKLAARGPLGAHKHEHTLPMDLWRTVDRCCRAVWECGMSTNRSLTKQ